MSSESAKQATDDFVDAQVDLSESSKVILDGLADSPLGDAVDFVADAISVGAQAGSTLFAGVTDPIQANLLAENFKGIASTVIQRAVIENTANKLNRLFIETSNTSLHMFELGPRFFYDTISKQSRRMNRAITAAQVSGAALASEAVAYNTFHQTLDRSDLDGLDENKAAEFRTAALTAVAEIETQIRKSASEGGTHSSRSRLLHPRGRQALWLYL